MILRRVARPLLGATFIWGGINALRGLDEHAKAAEPLLDKTLGRKAEDLPDAVPTDARTLVRIDAGVKIVAGAALALGVVPRVAALGLLGSIAPTTAASHAFWEERDPAQREAQLAHFVKNAGLAGGLLLAVADTEGKPSLAWRARHTAHVTGKRMDGTRRTARRQSQHGIGRARKQTQHGIGQARKQTQHGIGQARKQTQHGIGQARKQAQKNARQVRRASEQRAKTARKAVRSRLPR